MSRAFTSEEYEEREIKIEVQEKLEKEADYDLVFNYSKGRSVTDPDLPYEIGMNFLNGSDGFFQSTEFALKWLEKAIRANNVKAMLDLAEFYLNDTKKYGYEKPALLLEKARKLGSYQAEKRLDMDEVKDPSTKKAFIAFRLNAELENTEAMLKLAEGFEKQYYGKDKYKAAAIWYTKAFRNGNKDAAKRVLNLYYKKKIALTEEEIKFLRS